MGDTLETVQTSLDFEYFAVLSRFETLCANLELACELDDAQLAAETMPELEAVRPRLLELHPKVIARVEAQIAVIAALIKPTN
jgi:hypothetical protein